MSNYVNLNILGRSFKLNCPKDKENDLIRSAVEFEAFVNNIKIKSNLLQLDLALILAGVNLYSELLEKKQDNEHINQQINKILISLNDQ